jgi:hypothetical protein
VRVRTFELRLIAISLAAGWTVAAGFILLAYHPGGPIDLLVGLASGLPIVVALAGLVWPPVARGGPAFAGLVWLGLGGLLLLAPSIGELLNQLLSRGPQTLVPSAEAAYPWFLALLATSLFSGLGVARGMLGAAAVRRRRLVRGVLLGLVMTIVVGSVVAAVALGNELALRDRSVASSRFGPTNPNVEPPTCDQPLGIGRTARVDTVLSGDVDGRPLGSVEIHGIRSYQDFRWLAYVATTARLGQFGVAVVGDSAWQLTPGADWQAAPRDSVAGNALDVPVRAAVLASGSRVAAEMLGLAYFEGARARHCRVAIDGPTFREAFPQVAYLVGDADISRWRGELDYWVFTDGELGRASGTISGDAVGIVKGGLLGHVQATLLATERDAPHPVSAPLP